MAGFDGDGVETQCNVLLNQMCENRNNNLFLCCVHILYDKPYKIITLIINNIYNIASYHQLLLALPSHMD
jgi:hypothetical protein